MAGQKETDKEDGSDYQEEDCQEGDKEAREEEEAVFRPRPQDW